MKKKADFKSMSQAQKMEYIRSFKKKGVAKKKVGEGKRGKGILSYLGRKAKEAGTNAFNYINKGLKDSQLISKGIDIGSEALPSYLGTATRWLNNKFIKPRGYGKRGMLQMYKKIKI